jgi:uncharacterized caspase-like protein
VRAVLLAFVVVAISAAVPLAGQADRCAAARDLVRNTRMKLGAEPAPAALADGLLGLQRATEMCPGLGDAFYFLSLIGEAVKDRRTTNWRAKATLHGSEAMRRGEPLAADPELSRRDMAGLPSLPAVRDAVRVSPYVKRKLALVVGVSQFKDSGITALKYTSADARAVAEALRQNSRFDSVKMLIDQEATRRNILDEIEQLAKVANPDDLVVLFISSHGSPENLDTAGINYIVTHDTEVNNLYATAYEMYDLLRDMNQRIKAGRVIAFLDTCYSGGTFRELPVGWQATSRSLSSTIGIAQDRLLDGLRSGARQLIVEPAAPQPAATQVAQGVGRVIITSSSQAERSWEDASIGHGYFTYYLLQALRRPGPVSVESLFSDLRVRVPEAVRRDKNQPQHPGMAQFPERVNLYLNDRLR